MDETKVASRAWLVWLLGGLFFLMDYFVRISPSVITNQLMSTFHVSAFALGGLSAVFYYSYLFMQVPVGVLVDKYGPYRLLAISILVCALGSFLFGYTDSITVLYFSRFLIGFGGAFSFVGTLKLIYNWFPVKYFAILAGVTQALGMLGAYIGGAPMAKLFNVFGWRHTMIFIAGLFLLLCVVVMIFVRDRPKTFQKNQHKEIERIKVLPGVYNVIKRPQVWINSLYIGLLYGPTAAFAGLWGVPYLRAYYHQSTTLVAAEVGMMFLGLAVGCPLFGWWSNAIRKRIPVMKIAPLVCLITICIIIFNNHIPFLRHLSEPVVFILCFIYGVFNSGIIPSYALSTEVVPLKLSGITLGFTNLASLIIGALMLPIIGEVLDKVWAGKMVQHHAVYSVSNYQHAFILFPACFIAAFAVSFFLKETHCKTIEK